MSVQDQLNSLGKLRKKFKVHSGLVIQTVWCFCTILRFWLETSGTSFKHVVNQNLGWEEGGVAETV